MARQGAGILLVASVGNAGGAVVEELLDVVGRVLEAWSCGAWSIHQGMAPTDTLWEPTVVVSWLQGLTSFVLGEQGVHKIGTHGSCIKERCSTPPPYNKKRSK